MCDPITAGALALSAAGGFVQSRRANASAKAQANARDEQLRAELTRQKGFQDENNAKLQERLNDFTPEEQTKRRAEEVSERVVSGEAAIAGAPKADIPISGTAPKVVADTIARGQERGTSDARSFAGNNARLAAFGDLLLRNNIGVQRTAQDIGLTNSLARASSGLSGYEQAEASANAAKGPSMLGDLLSLGGAGLGIAGQAGIFDPKAVPVPKPNPRR